MLMTRSMTGFGRGSFERNGRSFTVEIKSVNHRYLDLNVKLPKNLLSLEEKIRKEVSSRLNRGKVDIFITQSSLAKSDVKAVFNEKLGDSYFQCLKDMKARYNLTDNVSLALIAKFPEVITVEQQEENVEELWDILHDALNEALNLLVAMREREGEKLRENIIDKCDVVKKHVDQIEAKSPVIIKEYRAKLTEKIKELLEDREIDDNRIAMEVAIFADKSCVDEEFVRLNSHLLQVKETLRLDEPVGRKLDFIVQEMNRETNTIASKSSDLEIVNLGLNIKNEIEKIREQIQNIE